MPGQENDRQQGVPFSQGIEQIKTAHAGHAHIQHQAAGQLRGPGSEKGFGAAEGLAGNVAGFEQPGEGVTNGVVVVHQVGTGAHGFSSGKVKVKVVPVPVGDSA